MILKFKPSTKTNMSDVLRFCGSIFFSKMSHRYITYWIKRLQERPLQDGLRSFTNFDTRFGFS